MRTSASVEFEDVEVSELVDSVAKAIEIGIRLARTLGTDHVHQGWHISSTTGQVAAGVAAAAVLRLGHEDVARVIGLSATQVAGLGCALGTMTKPFHFGKAAANGVESALLVRSGVTAPRAGLEGRRGLLAVLASQGRRAELVQHLGNRWLATELVPKPYPCGFVAHPIVDAAVGLAPEMGRPEDVSEVVAHVHPSCLDFMGITNPGTHLEAKLSAAFCIAAALRYGRLGLRQFSEAEVNDPETRRLMARVRLEPDEPSMDSARLLVRRASGQLLLRIDPGSAGARRMTDQAVWDKGFESASRSLRPEDARRLVDACLRPVAGATARDLGRLARVDEV